MCLTKIRTMNSFLNSVFELLQFQMLFARSRCMQDLQKSGPVNKFSY